MNYDNLFYVGQRFNSYGEIAERLHLYDEKRKYQFFVKTSKTLKSAYKGKTAYEEVLNPNLIYEDMYLYCGNKQNNSGGSYEGRCKANLAIRLSLDKKTLQVTEFNDNHNHDPPQKLKKRKIKRKANPPTTATPSEPTIKSIKVKLEKSATDDFHHLLDKIEFNIASTDADERYDKICQIESMLEKLKANWVVPDEEENISISPEESLREVKLIICD